MAEAALRAGCRYYFGYPITPQSEVPEYLSMHLPRVGGVFVQAESELAAVSMLAGASMAGARAMTSSSGPGFSLMQEGVSYMAGQEIPAVIANLMRGGPGLGNIAPSQADYFQVTRGGGHGDYRCPVLAPWSGQELCDFTMRAFELADSYRNPAVLAADGLLAQMMEPVEFPEPVDVDALPAKPWAVSGTQGGEPKLIASLNSNPRKLEAHNYKLTRKYDAITRREARHQSYLCHDAELVVAAYGTAARIAHEAVQRMRELGYKVGLFRPQTLWPFPEAGLKELVQQTHHVLVFEMCGGQMVEDVRLSIEGRAEVHFYGRPGGVIPTPAEVAHQISHHYHRAGLLKTRSKR